MISEEILQNSILIIYHHFIIIIVIYHVPCTMQCSNVNEKLPYFAAVKMRVRKICHKLFIDDVKKRWKIKLVSICRWHVMYRINFRQFSCVMKDCDNLTLPHPNIANSRQRCPMFNWMTAIYYMMVVYRFEMKTKHETHLFISWILYDMWWCFRNILMHMEQEGEMKTNEVTTSFERSSHQ